MNYEMSARTNFRPWEHRKLDNSLLQQVVQTSSNSDSASGTEESSTLCEYKQSIIRSYQSCSSSERKMYSPNTGHQVTCILCGKIYSNKYNLRRHLKIKHFLQDEELDKVCQDSINLDSSDTTTVSAGSTGEQLTGGDVSSDTPKRSSTSKVSVNAKSVEHQTSSVNIAEQISKKCIVKLQNIGGDSITILEKLKSPTAAVCKSPKTIEIHKHEKPSTSKGKFTGSKGNKGSAEKKPETVKKKSVSARPGLSKGNEKKSSTDKKEKLRKILGNKATKGKVYKRTLKSHHKVKFKIKIERNRKNLIGYFQSKENKRSLRNKANLVVNEVKQTLLESKRPTSSEQSKSGNPPILNIGKEESKSFSLNQTGLVKGSKNQSTVSPKTTKVGESSRKKGKLPSGSKAKSKTESIPKSKTLSVESKSKQHIQKSHRNNKNVKSSIEKNGENSKPSKNEKRSPLKGGKPGMENVEQTDTNISVVSMNEVRSQLSKSKCSSKEEQKLPSATTARKFGKSGIVSEGDYKVKVVDFRSRSKGRTKKGKSVNADVTVDETGDAEDSVESRSRSRSPFKKRNTASEGVDIEEIIDISPRTRGRLNTRKNTTSDMKGNETGDADTLETRNRSRSPLKKSNTVSKGDDVVTVMDISPRLGGRSRKQNIDPDMAVDETGDARLAVGSRTRSKSPKKLPKSKIQPEVIEDEEKPPSDVPPPLYSVGLQRANHLTDTPQETVDLPSNNINIQSNSVLELLPNVSSDNLHVNWTNTVPDGEKSDTSNKTVVDRTLFNLFTPESVEWELPPWKKQKADTEVDFKSVKLKITKDFQSETRIVRSAIPCSNIMDVQLKITRDFSKTKRTVVPKAMTVSKLTTVTCSDDVKQEVGKTSQMNTCIADRETTVNNSDTDTVIATCSMDTMQRSVGDKHMSNCCPVKSMSGASSTESNRVAALVLDNNCNLIAGTKNKSHREAKISEDEIDVAVTPFRSEIVDSSKLSLDNDRQSLSQDALRFAGEILSEDDESNLINIKKQKVMKMRKKGKIACDKVEKSATNNESLENFENVLGKASDISNASKGKHVNTAEVRNDRNKCRSDQQSVVDSCIEGMTVHDEAACCVNVDAASVLTVGSSEDNLCRDEEIEMTNGSSVASSRLITKTYNEQISTDNSAIGVEIVSSTTLLSESNGGRSDNKDYCDKLMQNEETWTSADKEVDGSFDNVSSGKEIIINSHTTADVNKSSVIFSGEKEDVFKEMNNSDETEGSDQTHSEKSSVSFNDVEVDVSSKTGEKNPDTNITTVITKENNKLSDLTDRSYKNDNLSKSLNQKPENDIQLEEENVVDLNQSPIKMNMKLSEVNGTEMNTGKVRNLSEISVHESTKLASEDPVVVVELADDTTDYLTKGKRLKRKSGKEKRVENSYDELDGLAPGHDNVLFISELEKGNFESCLQCLQSDGLTKLIDLDSFSEDQLKKIVDRRSFDEQTENYEPETSIEIFEDEDTASVTVKPVNGKFKNDKSYINRVIADLFQMFNEADSDQMDDNVPVSDHMEEDVAKPDHGEDHVVVSDHRKDQVADSGHRKDLVADSDQIEDNVPVSDYGENNMADPGHRKDHMLVSGNREDQVADSDQMEDTLLASDQMEDTVVASLHREDNLVVPDHKVDHVINSCHSKSKTTTVPPSLQNSGDLDCQQNKKRSKKLIKSASSGSSECLKDSSSVTDQEQNLQFTTDDADSQTEDETSELDSSSDPAVLAISDDIVRTTNLVYRCKLCGKKYKHQRGLKRHGKKLHADAKDINELVIEVVDETVRKYTVKKPEKEKISILHNEQSAAVPVGVAVDKAQQMFNSSPKTTARQKNIKNAIYVCSICNNEYRQSSNLQLHIKACHPECENVVLEETETVRSLQSSPSKPELVVSENQVNDLKEFLRKSDKQGDEISPALVTESSNSEVRDDKTDEEIRAKLFRHSGLNVSDKAVVKVEKFPLLEKEVHLQDMVLTQQSSGRSSYWNVKNKSSVETRKLELKSAENVDQKIANDESNAATDGNDGINIAKENDESNTSIDNGGSNTAVDNNVDCSVIPNNVDVSAKAQKFDIGINITFSHTDQLDLRDNPVTETNDAGIKNCPEAVSTETVVSNDRKKSKHKTEPKSKKRKREGTEEPAAMTDFEMAISAPRTDVRKSKKKKLERQNSSTSISEKVLKPLKSQVDPETSNEPSSKIVKNILRKKGLEKKSNEIPVVEKPAPFEEILAQNKTKKVSSTKPYMLESQKKTTAVYQNMLVTQPAKFNCSFKKVQRDSNNSAEERDLWRSPLANTGQDVDLKFKSSLSKSLNSEAEVNPSSEKSSSSVGNSKNYLLEIMKDIPSIHDTSTNKFVSPFDNPLVSPKSGTKHSGFAVPNQFKSPLKWNFEETVSKSASKDLLKVSSGKTSEGNPQDLVLKTNKEPDTRKVNFESNILPKQDSSSNKSKLDLKSVKELESDDYLDYNEDLTLTDEDEGDETSGKNMDVLDFVNTDIPNSKTLFGNVELQNDTDQVGTACGQTADTVTHSEEKSDENLNTVADNSMTVVNGDNSVMDFDVSNAKILPDGIHCVMSDEELKDSFNDLSETEDIEVTEKVVEDNIGGPDEAEFADDDEECLDDNVEEDRSDEADDESSEVQSDKGVEEINLSDFDDDDDDVDMKDGKVSNNEDSDDDKADNDDVDVKDEKVSDKEDSDDDDKADNTEANCAASVVSRVSKKTDHDDALSIYVDSDEQISLCGDLDEEDLLDDVDQDKRSETGTQCSQASDMDLVDEQSLVHTNIQCGVKIQSSQKVPEILMPIPPFCNDYLSRGICKKKNCGFMHTGHPDQNQKLKSGIHKIIDAFNQRNKIKAFDIYNTLKQNNYGTLPGKILDNLLCLAVDVGAVDSAFQLLGDLFKQNMLDNNMASVIIRLCGHRPYIYVEQLWSLFECIEAKCLEPEQDAVEILLRAFLAAKQWQKLWKILQYCNNLAGFVIPRVIAESAMSVCVKNPTVYLKFVTMWISTCDINIFFQINQKIIVELLDVFHQNGCRDLAAMLKHIVSDPLLEKEESPHEDLNEYDWNQENVMQVLNTENYKSHLHRLNGCKLTKNWDYLASMFVDLCRNLELTNQNFLKVYCGVLFNAKNPDVMVADFRQFVENVYKHYEIELQGDVLIQLDRPSMARIGAMLLLQCYEDKYWVHGYHLIIAMHQLGVLYYKCQRINNKDTVLVAVEVCINTRNAESALQIFDRSQWFHTAQNNMGYALCLLQKITNILLEKQHSHKALQVLGILVEKLSHCSDQEFNADEMCWQFKNLINISCKIGDPTSAVAAFQLHKRVNNVGPLDVMQLRLLLKCCAEQGWFPHAQEFCEMCIKLGAYPAQNLECEPRFICLSSEMASVEHFLLISYYLDGLYHFLCQKVLDGYGISEKDYCLAICVVRQTDGVNGQFQAPNSNNLICKLVIDILKRDVTPPLEGYFDAQNIIHIDPATLKKHMEEKDANGRRQGLRVTVGPGAPRTRRNMKGQIWARKQAYRR